ncbi:MAG TPA: serpin family protein [Planctomycetota bacterium]|nr:serpin family protein [Planctomycetota bacterium]
MRSKVALYGVALLLVAGGCGMDSKPDNPTTPKPGGTASQPPGSAPTAPATTAEIAKAAEGGNRFACELYAKLAAEKKGDNLFLSPYSISTALTMTWAGARGQTAAEMEAVLRLPTREFAEHLPPAQPGGVAPWRKIPGWPPERLHAAMAALSGGLNIAGKDGRVQLSIANALWGQKGHPFLPEFLALNKASYGAGLETVDFAGDAEGARKTINAWVEKQTQEKVKDLLPPGVLDKLTRLVLTNAIHFRGQWQEPFDPAETKDRVFRLGGGRRILAPTMKLHTHFEYAKGDDFQAVELPYRGARLAMLVLLPDRDDGLAELEKRLTPELLAGLKLARTDPVVQLPRFALTCDFRLDEQLRALGMADAFAAGKADFSGLDGVKPPSPGALFIAAVLHKAFVEVNEKGTEAGAATAVLVAKNGHAPPAFTADHPFLFLVRDRETGTILFLGRVTDPAPGAPEAPAPEPKK